MEGPISTIIDYLVDQPQEQRKKTWHQRPSAIEPEPEVTPAPVVEEESWKDWGYRHRYKIVGVLLAVGGVFAWWYLMGGGNPPGGNPPPMDTTGGAAPAAPGAKPELTPIFKDLVKAQNEIGFKNKVVNNLNNEVNFEQVVKEIKLPKVLPKVDLLLREDILKAQLKFKEKLKEKDNMLYNKIQTVELISNQLTVQKEKMMVDSIKMVEFANKYNLSELKVKLNEWSNIDDKAWGQLYAFNSEIKCEIAMTNKFSIEELDKLIIKVDKSYANCFDLIKQSGELYAKVELLYKNCYNKMYKGNCN